jgi:branched-chain amino acid transport system substrate-binding protein
MPSWKITRLGAKTLALAVLAGCLLASAAANADDIKIGLLFGITGQASSFVPPLIDAAKLAVDEINAGGGILKGSKSQTVLADTKGTAQGGIDAATKLVKQDNV